MQSKIKIFGHPVHPILVPFPIAFNTATMICCITYASTNDAFWFRAAFIANCTAIVTAVIAMLPGLIDWLSIPELTDAKSTGLKHLVANVFSLGFFIASAVVLYANLNEKHPSIQSNIIMTVFGFLVMLYAGFKGWALVQKHHIGVDITAHEEIPEQDKIQKNAVEIFTDIKKP